jgi:dipeptidyl aminopeptidase/acylaminoacyl peptidase
MSLRLFGLTAALDPTRLVIDPEEGHAIAKPEDQRDIEERLPAWFDRYVMR